MTDAQLKTQRVLRALERQEPDRVPIGEFFWTNFVRRAKRELDVGPDFNPYTYWDLDLIVITPNMDPRITGIEVLEDTPARKLVRTGFGATIERRHDYPMPHYLAFETQTIDQVEALEVDPPSDPRRYYEAVDDQINSVGDDLILGVPSFVDRVDTFDGALCMFGSVCEAYEWLWRAMGPENILVQMAQDPEGMARCVQKAGDFLVGIVEEQVRAARGRLSGIYIWGDIAYRNGMLFSPSYWRHVFKPQVARVCEAAHAAGLKTIYHGCGNASVVYPDLIEAGVDAYNPIEAKADLDVVALKRQYGRQWCFNGNIDVRVLATNDREKVRREVLTKLNAAKGGGYILQSDHSMPDNVAPATYDYVVSLARKHGLYPLDLGEFDVDIQG